MKAMFRIYVIILVALCVVMSCKERQNDTSGTTKVTASNAVTTVQWRKVSYDFNTITEGEQVAYSFYLKNTGTQNLIISKVDAGCICTTVDYDSKPIAPQEERKIEVIFDSQGRYGQQYKEVIFYVNTKERQTKISFTAQVN